MRWGRRAPGAEGGTPEVDADRELATTAEADPDHTDSAENADGGAAWTWGARLRAHAVTAVVLLGLATGPVALGSVVLNMTAPAEANSVPAPAPDTVSQQLAGEFAAQFVGTWLSITRGEEAALDPFLVGSAGYLAGDVPAEAGEPSVVANEQLAAGTWAVTVAVTINEPIGADNEATAEETGTSDDSEAPEPETAGVRRYFHVPVVADEAAASYAALTLPSPVSGPSTASTGLAGPDYRDTVPLGSPLADTAQSFVGSYLTGSGEIARVLSPETAIEPLTPAPYTTVSLSEVAVAARISDSTITDPADGEEVDLLVQADATAASGVTSAVSYALSLTARAGRWEISSIDLAPLASTEAEPRTSPSEGEQP